MEYKTQHYACPLCNKDVAKDILQKQEFHIVRCSDCGFVYVNPRLADDQLGPIYRHNYFHNKDYGYADYEQEKRLRVKNFERWLMQAAPFISRTHPVKALDVGCAAGYCMDVMKQKGWDAEGLELDEELSRELNNGGYKVWNRKLEDFATDTRYDLITLFDVIEHIPNVDAAFTQLNHLLTDDGILVMITPNHASFQRKLFGKNWFQYKPIEHIQYFTLKTLSVFAERNGLRIVHHEKAGQHADAAFIINRLSYYNFPFLRKICNGLFSLFGLKNKCFYPGTGSLFVVLKKA